MEKLTLTPEEAGERLGISRGLVYKSIKNGQIPSVKIGKRRFVPVAALAAALMERAQPGKGNRRKSAA